MTTPPVIRHISKCFIKPNYNSENSQNSYHLTPWDLAMLSAHYIQRGLLFPKPSPLHNQDTISIIDHLKNSLSDTLIHFFPLTGRFVTEKTDKNPPSSTISVNCNNTPGAEFLHASAQVSIGDILSPIDVPLIVNSLFTLTGAVNYDGQTLPLLSVQVTELVDGIFIGCSLNHAIVDGNSFWHFFNTWSEISRQKQKNKTISRPPILTRWFLDGYGPIIDVPFSHYNDFIERYTPPLLRERIFHFSPQAIARLKGKANEECNTTNISSFQALSSLVWRSMTRVRHLGPDQKTTCRMAANNRPRLNPPLTRDYFGNCILTVSATTTAGELLSHGLGWSAWLVHEAVRGHTDEKVREWLEGWVKNPFVYKLGQLFDPCSIHFGSSPRFDMYGNDFGWGKAVAVRSGYANKFSGKVSAYPGSEGEGSVDLEVCLVAETMSGLESDEEFVDAFSS